MAKIRKRKQPPTGKRGARRQYNREKLTPMICARLATGEPLAVILRDLGLGTRTVNSWREADPAIAAQFDEARDLGFDAIAHECLVIANTPQLGVIEKLEPMKTPDGQLQLVVTERRQEDMLGHRKLQIETRLKLLAKWDPRRYGERVTLAGDKEAPLEHRHTLSDSELEAIAAGAKHG